MAKRKLSQRQIERIRAIQERRRAKLETRTQTALEDQDDAEAKEGLVVARHGAYLAVVDEQERIHHCLSRQNIGHPVCGDRVVWQAAGPDRGVVTALLERHSTLSRPDYSGRDKPLAANLSRLVVVLAPEPEPSDYLLDQYLVAAEQIATEHNNVQALIALNKIDLLSGDAEAAFLQRFAHYEAIGYPLIPVSAHREHGLDALMDALKGQTGILVGQSGVGKSSLINALLPDLDLQVGRLSHATGLGRHTTSAATLYRLPSGGSLIDSPGVRSFRLGKLERRELEYGFRDLRPYIGHCRFADCRHREEPGCAVREALEQGKIDPRRLDNLLHMAERM